MPNSICRQSAERGPKRSRLENYLARFGIIGESACWRLCRYRHKRHSFAVATLLRWYREGVDPNSRLMHLATFLGHTDPNSTAVYLTITEELLREADQRFRSFAPTGGLQ